MKMSEKRKFGLLYPKRAAVIGASVILLFGVAGCRRQSQLPAKVVVDPDGTVHVPAQAFPLSTFLSPEAKKYMVDHLTHPGPPPVADIAATRRSVEDYYISTIARTKEIYPVDIDVKKIGGVNAWSISPKEGVPARNKSKVLINLHGGGFTVCFPACAEMESIPLASIGGMRVVTVDYRQGPEYKFPAASEDVAAVYRELLKQYKPSGIGIYGCSAGGMLTAMSVAWFQKHDLPRPGAIGILCASAGAFGGDSTFWGTPLGDGAPTPPGGFGSGTRVGYLSDADMNDPLVAPMASSEVLAKFPPTMVLSGTRAFDMSAGAYSHTQLVKLGVDAELYLWEGLFHGFFYNSDVPESKDAFRVMARFFDRHLKGN